MNKLIDNQIVTIDDIDLPLLNKYTWRISDSGYIFRTDSNGKKIYLHKEIYRLTYLESQTESFICDHIDRNKLNCQRSNLRLATKADNSRNSSLRIDNTTGFKGVSRVQYGYEAKISINGKKHSLGTYQTALDAAIAYNRKAIELFGEFACLNDVEDVNTNIQSTKEQKQKRKLCGVFKSGAKFRSRVTVKGKKINLGSYATELEAACAYNQYLIQNNLSGTHYRLNDITARD